MQILNLINRDNGTVKYKIINFPDGESHIKLEDINRKEKVIVICRITNANDLFILMQVGDILNRQGVIFSLQIFYLMSMRMDRVISFDEAYSLNIVTSIINNMNPESVSILEAHSAKVGELLKEYWGDIRYTTPNFTGYLPVLPDEGALDRYDFMGSDTLICKKVRDSSTGELSGFSIKNPELLKDERYKDAPLIVLDDLCDGGGTFVGIANEIKKIDRNRKLAIHVVHMVNVKGIDNLSKHYDEVYFTNSYCNWDTIIDLPANVRVIKVI